MFRRLLLAFFLLFTTLFHTAPLVEAGFIKSVAKTGVKIAARVALKKGAQKVIQKGAQKTAKNLRGRGAGGSGKPKVHNPHFSSRKQAEQAARQRGAGKPDHDVAKTGSGERNHFHAVNKDGTRTKTGIHYTYGPKK
jgi:hypothetical protein